MRCECLERCESARGAEQRVVYSYMLINSEAAEKMDVCLLGRTSFFYGAARAM